MKTFNFQPTSFPNIFTHTPEYEIPQKVMDIAVIASQIIAYQVGHGVKLSLGYTETDVSTDGSRTWWLDILSTEYYLVGARDQMPSKHKHLDVNAGHKGVSVNTVYKRYINGQELVRKA